MLPKKKSKKKSGEEKPKVPAAINGGWWATSEARHQLGQDIIDKVIPGHGDPPLTLELVEDLWKRLYEGNPVFANYPFCPKRYKKRIESLQEIVRQTAHWAKFDDAALAKDMARHPAPATNIRGQLRWAGSNAEKLLKEDIKNDKHKYIGYTPRHFRTTRPDYLLFDLDVFRKHIDQCKQAKKEFGKTPGQQKAKRNQRKVGGKEYKRGDAAAV